MIGKQSIACQALVEARQTPIRTSTDGGCRARVRRLPISSMPQISLPIGDYALIGDCHSAALVSSAGSIDWCCLPRFDSDSCFGRLLDHEPGGHFSIAPAGAWTSRREYRGDSLVLVTT